jgi:hypothetical protein
LADGRRKGELYGRWVGMRNFQASRKWYWWSPVFAGVWYVLKYTLRVF